MITVAAPARTGNVVKLSKKLFKILYYLPFSLTLVSFLLDCPASLVINSV